MIHQEVSQRQLRNRWETAAFPPRSHPLQVYIFLRPLFLFFLVVLAAFWVACSECCCLWTLSVCDETVSSHIFDLYRKAAASRTSILFVLL